MKFKQAFKIPDYSKIISQIFVSLISQNMSKLAFILLEFIVFNLSLLE